MSFSRRIALTLVIAAIIYAVAWLLRHWGMTTPYILLIELALGGVIYLALKRGNFL